MHDGPVPGLLPDAAVGTASQGPLRLRTAALNFSITAYKLHKLGQEASAPRASASSSVRGSGKSPAHRGFRRPEFACASRPVPAAQRMVGKCCGFD